MGIVIVRGKIDLGEHKLANVYRAPARKTKWKRTKMEKQPDDAYRQLWRLIDGAVRDSFSNHPEYLTDAGRRNAARSIVKRVTGALHGYAAQVAQGRSETTESLSVGEAAERADTLAKSCGPKVRSGLKAASWVRTSFAHRWRQVAVLVARNSRGER